MVSSKGQWVSSPAVHQFPLGAHAYSVVLGMCMCNTFSEILLYLQVSELGQRAAGTCPGLHVELETVETQTQASGSQSVLSSCPKGVKLGTWCLKSDAAVVAAKVCSVLGTVDGLFC